MRGTLDTLGFKRFTGSLLLAVALALSWPAPAGATIFWDDEMEPGTGSPYDYLVQIGVASYDTGIKVSGSASLRLNYPPECLLMDTCGGFSDRYHTNTANKWTRFYLRLSPDFQAHSSETKVIRSLTTGIHQMQWVFKWGTPLWTALVLQAPAGSAYNVYGQTLSPGQWYCIEMHEQLSTSGLANGLIESWVDGTLVLSKSDVQSRASGDSSTFNLTRLYRQGGSGNLWFDRVAVGDQRIGCSGSVPKSDTTPPAAPTGLLAR